MRRMQLLAHCTVLEKLPQTGGLRAGRAESLDNLAFCKAEEPRGSGGRAERSTRCSRMPELVMRSADRFAGADADIVPGDDRFDELPAGSVYRFSDRDGGRNDRRRGM